MKCNWDYDEHHDMWETECGYSFCFTEGKPNRDSFNYCPYCGKEIGVSK